MNKSQRLIAILALLIIPAMVQARTFARWHTSLGSFTAELYDELVPITAGNFRDLAQAGFYNNLIFHRVIEGFMIQDGCPNGTGTGGPGYTIQDEFHPDLLHNSAGVLAMARTSAPNSAGSQYYITLAPTPHLNGGYAVFGRIIEGLENVMTIGSVPTNASDRPITPVNIYQLRMLDLFIGNMFLPTTETVELLPDESQMFITEAAANSASISYQWFLNEVPLEETGFMLDLSFAPGMDHTLRCTIASSDSIAYEAIWNIQVASSNADSQAPARAEISLQSRPNPFSEAITILCDSKAAQMIGIDVFNIRGQKVRTLQSASIKQGSWNLVWDGKDEQGAVLPKGVYLLRMQAERGNVYHKVSKLQ
jgi:cyclophilin family peptidyl-prolyl cis-trans isomerase